MFKVWLDRHMIVECQVVCYRILIVACVCVCVSQVYEHVYETVDINSSPEVRANATAKVNSIVTLICKTNGGYLTFILK